MLWLVAAGGVQVELLEELSGDGVGYPDVKIFDEQDDAGSGVTSTDAYVVQAAGVAQGDFAGVVDAVVADAVVGGGW